MSGPPGPSVPPRLSVSTQGSSSFGTPPRRPQGARRRGVAPGLFVANPDSSDDDGSPSRRISPVKTTTSPVTASSSSSGGVRGAVPIPPSPLERSPATAKGAGLPLNVPSIPAPLSSPLPATPIFAQNIEQQSHSPVPPQPPPQPERHMRRAFTVPAPDQPRPSHEPRTASGSNFRDKAPSSPSRALPPLPSPPVGTNSPPASSQTSAGSTHALPPIPNPPTPSSVQSMPERPLLLHGAQRVESPEHSLNSAVSSDGGLRSLTGTLSSGRARSGSHMKRMLQVTLDNDNFALVDITGMHTAQAIMEVVFSKLRFADDDYPGLRMYRTEFGESPDPEALTPDDLLQLCEQHSDSKALLKFLVKQTGIPSASSAPVVPPANVPYRSNSHRRAEMPHINTDVPSNSSGRTPSRHSKEGSMSSASELFESRAGGGTSASEWSEVDADGEIRRRAAIGKGGSASSRSPLAEATASLGNVSPAKSSGGPPHPLISIRAASAAPSPSSRLREVDVPVSPFSDFPHDNRGSLTPTAPAFQVPDNTAGPSHRARPSGEGLGLNIDLDGMDEGTRALIEQFQREEEEARLSQIRRRRQEEEDAELARKEQESERDEWQRQQSLQAEELRRQQERDAAQAREAQAHERRLEEQRRAQEAATARWEANQEHDARAAVLNQSRRQNRDHWRQQGQLARMGQQGEGDSWVVVDEGRRSSLGERRPSDHQYPTVNPLFERPTYTSPQPNDFEQAVPIAANVAQHVQPRRPSVYSESTAAQDRLHDPRLHQLGRVQAGAQPIRRDTRNVHPFAYTRNDLQAQSLNNTRSMDNLRPFTPQAPGMRYQFASVPPRAAVTPTPGYQETRPYPVAAASRSPSMDRMQDGRYPEPVHSAPGRVPLQPSATSSGGMGVISFPSPQPRSGSPLARGSPGGGRRRSPDFDQSRPSSIHYDRSPPLATSPQTAALPRRPNTYYDETSPPHSARTVANDGYFASDTGTWRPRSGSEAHAYRSGSPYVPDIRRASESSATSDDAATALPYARPPDHSWLNVPRRHTDMSDTASIAGTVSSGFSEATVRARTTSADGEEDDSADTARAGEYQQSLNALLNRSQPVLEDDDDEDEATLWLTGPSQNTDSPRPLHRALALRPSPSKPSLTVNTSAASPAAAMQGSATTLSASDSATESEGDARVQRAKSFARPKDPNQWHMRPEPEMLYEHLDNFFPKIDLDKPIVEGASTPTTPASESSPQHPTASGFPPPPLHPSRTPLSPTRKSLDLPRQPVLPPPSHPARNAFNKAENRKSIRVMADYKRRTMQRENRYQPELNAAVAQRANDKKVERRKSSSMWGHRVVEVTPSKMSSGVPAAIPESPSSEGNKPVSWVKGELIGKGSYGRVYIAMNLSTLDVMAVKQVELPATERDRNDRRQMGMIDALKSEIALLKDLYHPNIVAYLGCETSPEYLSIFLEYVPGGTIASIYRTPNQARFEEQLIKFFTAQILEGLAYLHQKHIWHRDLKGDNILVDADGICKISDFGISKQTADAYDSFGQATNMKGSVFWMAPEVIHSDTERTYSGKVDIWSLGCVVLEMWSGKRPWGDMEQVAAMFELFTNRARPPLPPDMHLSDTALDFMNEKCLAKNPRDRPMAIELLKHPFITEYDPNWTFAGSKIGKAVKKRGAVKHHVAVPT